MLVQQIHGITVLSMLIICVVVWHHGGCDQSDRSPIGTATGIIRAGELKSCVITNVRW